MTAPSDTLTQVELIWLEGRIEHWIRFGRDVAEQILDRRRRILSFAPDSVFAYIRWVSNDYGTIISRIEIVRAVAPGEPYTTIGFMRPGGELLLRVAGWPKVQRVLALIDTVEQAGIDPVDVCPDHWRHIHNRLAADEEPRPYLPERHAVWLKRRRIGA
jgi:hypothetical protein